MNLRKQVDELRQRAGVGDDLHLVALQFSGCDDSKTGEDRAIRREAIGYTERVGGGRVWLAEDGESLAEVRARIKREAWAEGRRGVIVVAERYADEEAA